MSQPHDFTYKEAKACREQVGCFQANLNLVVPKGRLPSRAMDGCFIVSLYLFSPSARLPLSESSTLAQNFQSLLLPIPCAAPWREGCQSYQQTGSNNHKRMPR